MIRLTEWHFIQNLSYGDQLNTEDAVFVRLAYTARLHSVLLACDASMIEC